MVFESLVTDLINKYLGEFVENLDSSQLKIGIWGGDICLTELDLKESALDELDLPVKIKAGHIGKLTLKIPWKNLYTEPVIATIDGLYALAVPNVGIKYNAEKEEKEKQAGKQKKLLAMEEAKKLAAEEDKPKEKKKDSFAEKFATQVIKNLQVEVRNIHVRYEDRYTNPKQPFAIGVTLLELLFRTTDENWKPCIIKEAVSQIFKLVKLEQLSVYWNSKSELYEGQDKAEILKKLKAAVAPGNKTDFKYLVRPISSVAHLKLNTKPADTEYKIPKVMLTIIFDEISVGLAKIQYNDVLEMLEGFERVNLMGMYKKYKPIVPFKGHIKTWWHFAYQCILEETVRRRRRMWSWEHIRTHRDYKNRYRKAYISKLENKKVSSDLQKELDECERYLDVFNITVIRQQAEVESIKRGLKRAEEKKQAGWFGGWLGGGGKKKQNKDKGDAQAIQEQFYEQFNSDEKAKLYEAIGYQENEADPTLPKEFVAIRLVTKLNNLSVCLTDDNKSDPQILRLQLKNVFASVGQRPAASAIKVDLKMDKFNMHGTQQGEFIPRMVSSPPKTVLGTTEQQQALSLLDVLFETNPLDGLCDTRVRVHARPLQIIYDAITVNQMAEFFKPPKDIQLKQLSQAAMSKYEEIKEQSATGLQHAIDLKKYTEIAVDLQSSYVIVPHGGKLTKQKDVSKLVLDLGNLKVSTEKNQSDDSLKGQAGSLEEVMQKAYDKFHIGLDNIQLMIAHAGEDWVNARTLSDSPLHILRPISIQILLQKCMFDKDARMAKMKVAGELPLLSLNISDHRLQEILSLVQSIPLPEGAPPEPEDQFAVGPSDLPTVDVTEGRLAEKATSYVTEGEGDKPGILRSESSEFVNATDLELKFVLKEININIAQRINKRDIPLIKLVVDRLGTEVKMRTFDMSANAYLGGVYLQYLKIKDSSSNYVKGSDALAKLSDRFYQVTENGPLINIVNTPTAGNTNLLTVNYLKANPDGPEFATVYKKTEQSVNVDFSALELLLHLESILDLLAFAQSLQPPTAPKSPALEASPSKTDDGAESKVEDAAGKSPKKKKAFKKDPEVIDMQLNACLKAFAVCICTDDKLLTDIKIKGIKAGVSLQEAQTRVSAELKDISIRDPDPLSFYPNILEIQGSEVLALDLTMYNNNTDGPRYEDMSNVDMRVKVMIGRVKVTFLNKFVTDLVGFANHFQEAQAKLKEAGESMAEYTQDAVQNLQETASRLSLSVDMSAPIIFVPQNSKSLNVLLIDLGHLSLGNRFEMPGQRSQNGIPAVLEKMNVTLTDLKVSRALVDASQMIKSEIEILEPVTVGVDICRNIAAAWFHDVPDIELNGTMKAIQVSLSQGDFTSLMNVLNENLTEGQTEGDKDLAKTDAIGAPEPAADASVEDAIVPKTAVEAHAAPTSGTATSTKPWCKLKFKFCINSLGAVLYNGDSQLTVGIIKRDENQGLGSFSLDLIGLAGQMMSNSDMNVKVMLRNTIMDDKRASKKGCITRMLERSKKVLVESDEANMIDVSFVQESNNKNIDVHMSSLYICVCLDFLMSLADFFVKGLPAKPETPAPAAPSPSKEEVKAIKPKEPAPAPVQGDTNILVKIDRPEIILIEDQSNFSSNGLSLNMELLFRMRQTPETMDMSASIKNLAIVTCKYDNRDGGAQILVPCEFSFYSKTPTGQGAHMDVSTSDLILNISPGTIQTMSAIAGGLSKQGEEGQTEEAIPGDLWQIKKLNECNFWFLKEEEAEDALVADIPVELGTPVEEMLEERGEQKQKEKMILKVPAIVVKLEGGVGNRTVPLLVTEMAFEAEVRDWSGKLAVESSLKLEVAYYNEKMSVWEPLIEPVMDQGRFRRWELQLEVTKNDDIDITDDDEETETVKMPPAKMSINVKSSDELQVTMTKACLESLTNLSKAFSDAYALVEPTQKAGEITAPYIIRNDTDLDLLLKLDPEFEMPKDAANLKVKLPSSQLLTLNNKVGPKLKRQASIIKAAQEGYEKKMIFQVEQFNATREVTIKRAEKRLFHVDTKKGDMWAIVCETKSSAGQKTVTFRSSIQVTNHLEVPVEVFFKSNSGETLPIAVVNQEDVFSLPLTSIYTNSCNFMFRPCKDGFPGISEEVSWKGAENLGVKLLSSKGQDGHEPFYFKVRAEIEDVYYEKGEELNAKTTNFHLHPTVIFHNLLPYPVKVLLEGTAANIGLEPGSSIPLDNACVGKSVMDIEVVHYLGSDWNGRRKLEVDTPEMSVWTFETTQNGKRITMDMGLHFKQSLGSVDISLYSPYWMINKTNLLLTYKAGDDEPVEHPARLEDIVMFSFRKGSLFSTKKKDEKTGTLERKKDGGKQKKEKVKEMKQSGKASLKIGEGDWSDKFSLDTVGSSGTVQSKTKTRTWEVGVSIILSSSALTKVVTFTPYYVLVNTSTYTMICQEVGENTECLEVPPKECVPLWPKHTSKKEMVMQARLKDTELSTSPFLFNKAHSTLLKLDNEYGGINTECTVTESAMVTNLTHYKQGMAAVQIINHSDRCDIQFHQSGVKTIHVLKPEMTCLYTWEDSLGKRDLVWSCGDKKDQKNDLTQDGVNEFFYDSDTKVYWVSFLNGMQRVLLFTHDLALATVAQEAGELERIEQEITVTVHGLGLSLVNNYHQQEVAYLGITSSGVIWEEKKKRFKALNLKTCMALEGAYQKFVMDRAAGHSTPEKLHVDKMEVNFNEMRMMKPNKRMIRRSFQDGIWIQYKTSPHQVQFHAKINRLQLDNQLKGAVFQTVLSPMPPPKSVAAESVPKPFTEVSMMMRKQEHSNVSQMKYFKVLIQEMQLKVDQGFLNSVLELFSSNQETPRELKKQMFEADVKNTEVNLVTTMGLSLAHEQKMFYDYLHLSPIKVHLSFSLQGGGGDGKSVQLQANVINIFLQSVGVVLTDVQDVVFKLGFFERNHSFYNNQQLVGEMSVHYASQAIKQMYVLVLGLDVLGNPFGLLRGLGEGIEDLFYEPYQGAIQGPEEFAEGLALGVRSLFGHAVGGAAGAVSRITGTLGKGIAALTLDDDYQKKRREAMNKRPANVGEGFARGGKGLVMGVFDGVTGIVRKPIEGAKQEGVGGFFKGVGKGLVGVVTRPTSGVIDFASSSFEGIKRIADNVSEIHRLRPPRRFHRDQIIRAYNLQESEGCAILMETEKGRFYKTDDYLIHTVVTKDAKNVFLVTNKRIIFVSRGEIFGSWNCEFTYVWAELKEKPKVSAKGIEVVLKEKEKRLFGSSSSKKDIHILDKKVAEMIVHRISDAMDNTS